MYKSKDFFQNFSVKVALILSSIFVTFSYHKSFNKNYFQSGYFLCNLCKNIYFFPLKWYYGINKLISDMQKKEKETVFYEKSS